MTGLSDSTKTEHTIEIAPWQDLALFRNPYEHLAMLAGVGVGKTWTGAHYVIQQIEADPSRVGLIGANTYDQLSTATLHALFQWLEEYEYEYVVDRQPPRHWKEPRKLKTYNNTIQIRVRGQTALILTRVLSEPDISLRGFEISWYWLDETRDTTEYAHNVLLGRMRQSSYRKGLITTTTNGEDWIYNRFVRARKGQSLYGSLHVPTYAAVQYGILQKSYYELLRASYSPLLAQQELDAKHVNVFGGRAYYAACEDNRKRVAPWGDEFPNPERALIVGCDFNFSPAPCVWEVGQIGPAGWDDHVHWFGEIAELEISTRQMARILVSRFPGFHYRIFGDASGTRGTTSNAGEHDYNQIGHELNDAGCLYSIDVNPSNPLVKDRVENVNAKLKNAIGETFVTYNPDACPLLDGDFKNVGWKRVTGNIMGRTGRLDDGGDPQRTHAADAVGYPLFKLFPPGRRLEIIESIPSTVREGIT